MNNNIVEQIQILAYNYRGQIINDLIYLERLIDEAISRHFCDNSEKRSELMEVILGNEKISFFNKIQVLDFIFKKHKSDFISNAPNIFTDIRKLIDERNIVAHYLLDTSIEGQNTFIQSGNIGFVKFRNSTSTLSRTQDDYNKFHELTAKYINLMSSYLANPNNN